MSRNGSGTYTRVSGTPYVYDTVIDQVVVNAEMEDIATALTASLAKDGQTTPTANLPMGTYRHTGVGNAAARTDYASAAQVQDGTLTHLSSVAGTNTVTATAAISMTAYVVGQVFSFVPANTNTGATTININSIGAGAVQLNGAALVAGEIRQNVPVEVKVTATTPVFEIIGNGSMVTTAATQTLTNKTLTAPALNGTVTTTGLTLPALTLGGNVSSTGNPSLNIGTGALTAGTLSAGITTITNAGGIKRNINTSYLTLCGGTTPGTDASITIGSTGYANNIYANGDIYYLRTVAGTDLVVLTATNFTSPMIYSDTSASAANVVVASDGTCRRSTSAGRWKDLLEPMDPAIALRIVETFEAWYYRSLCSSDNPAWTWYGGLAERLAEIDPRLVHWGYEAEDYEDAEIVDDVVEQIVDVVSEDVEIIEIIDGVPTLVIKPVKIERPRVVMTQVLTGDGTPVVTHELKDGVVVDVTLMYPVPVTQVVRKSHIERRLKDGATLRPVGIQYERLTVPLMVVAKMHQADIAQLKSA